MSSPRAKKRRRRRSQGRWWVVLPLSGLAVLALALALSVEESPEPAGTDALASGPGPMGGRTMPTPGQSFDTAGAGGITVEGARIEMGRVPLNTTVTPTWRLHNPTSQPIAIGQPRATVVTGCCPGQLGLDTQTVPPGGHAMLTFPLQMHPGMDGPHDFRVTVPVGPAGEPLVLGVTGDFRG